MSSETSFAKLLTQWHRQSWIVCGALVSSVVLGTSAVCAQVAGDGSTGTQVNGSWSAPCNRGTCTITGGTRAANSLFHSFRQFSVPTGSEAVFDAADVRTIFARVTGGDRSVIDGRLSTLSGSSVDLFLLNPSGILLGANASLNLGGSFVASTADRIIFNNGAAFSVTDRAIEPSLLSVSVPIGLQFGANPAPIVVQGTGNRLFSNPDSPEVDRTLRPAGLAVPIGQTLALLSGNIRLQGGNLTAEQGRVELGSVGSQEVISVLSANPGWRFSYPAVSQFRNIQLTRAASIDVSGNGGGQVQLRGRRVTLAEGSVILVNTLGSGGGGNLQIQADAFALTGTSTDVPLPSSLLADSALAATSRGGDILIESRQLAVTEGAQISAITFGVGDAGSVTLRAEEMRVDGGSPFGPSVLFVGVEVGATGRGGNLTIDTQRLRVTNGASIAAASFGTGTTGNLTINADKILLTGFTINPFGEPETASLSVDMLDNAVGQGGSLTINADRLRISNGAQISSGTFGAGNAGMISVRAREIEIDGGSAPLGSGIFAPVAPGATGRGGAIDIQTEHLTVLERAQIATSTAGNGNAGNLTIRASEQVRLREQSPLGRSGLFASAVEGTGVGGDLTVITDRLIVENGATISVSNFPSTQTSPFEPGSGSAGNLNLSATEILLNNQASLTADTVVGDRANINLQTDRLVLRRGSRISTNATGTASGGNIRIAVPEGFVVSAPNENSDITANAVQGNGGRVEIAATGIYGIQPRDRQTALSDITTNSEFGLAGIVTLNTPDVETLRGVLDVPESPDVPEVVQGCEAGQQAATGRFTNAGRGGIRSQSGDLLTPRTVLGDVSLPDEWRQPATESVSMVGAEEPSTNPIVEAQGWFRDAQGAVVLVAELPSSNQAGQCSWQTSSIPDS